MVPHRRPAEPPSCHSGMLEMPREAPEHLSPFLASPRRLKTCAELGSLRNDLQGGAATVGTPDMEVPRLC